MMKRKCETTDMELEPQSKKQMLAQKFKLEENDSKSKKELTIKVETYFKQLTTGCGKSWCDNPLCASNTGLEKLTPNQAAAIALSMAVAPGDIISEFTCENSSNSNTNSNNKPEDIVPVSLTLERVKSAYQAESAVQDFTQSIRLFGSVFGTPESLSISFLKNQKSTKLDGTDTGLDLEAVHEFYNILNQFPDNVKNVLLSSCERMLDSIKNRLKSNQSLSSLRKFIILLKNPNLFTEEYQERFTGILLYSITEISEKGQNYLINNYFGKMVKDEFVDWLQNVHNFIAIKIIENEDLSLYKNRPVVSAAKFLGWLWKLNKIKHYVPYTMFYNESIEENLDTRVDYVTFLRKGFAYCLLPFLIKPQKKSELILFESRLSQRQRLEESIEEMFLHGGNPQSSYLLFSVSRQHCVRDSIDTMMVIKLDNQNNFKKRLRIIFDHEQGVDEGGVQKEWFQLIVGDLFSPKYGMFIADEKTRLHSFNSTNQDVSEYELLGIVLGLAIYNSVILDLHFPLHVYKQLCGVPVGLLDLEEVDPGLFTGLNQLLNMTDPEDIASTDLNFQITLDHFGTTQTYDLKENGSNMPVTIENVKEYVELYVKYLLVDSIAAQFGAFKSGFDLVTHDEKILLSCEPEELRDLIIGCPELDFYELEKGTEYEGYEPDNEVIKNFWEVVHSFTEEEKKLFLTFTTGSDRSPIGGLGNLDLVITREGPDSDR
eukprot:TRINITY_DN3462_c0_g1_i1.p1 TRINITY_DN3462_c0_g1~~TRINITY_DN3462_c0_g1_i1.p1  ORF type:complete len:713 (+),score=137.11 TRINITY_DN3462_c0_g1_i1:1237-3375(+)